VERSAAQFQPKWLRTVWRVRYSTATDRTVISEYCTAQGNCRQLIESNYADSAVPVRKQRQLCPLPPLLNPPPFISFYHSLTPPLHPFTTTIPSDKVRFTETFGLMQIAGVGYPGCCTPVSIGSLHYKHKSQLNLKLWQL